MQNKNAEKKYFDAFTSDESWNAFTERTYRKIVRLFVSAAKPAKTSVIIDMGCGTGELTQKVHAASFKNIRGFDISPNCIKSSKTQFPGISFEVRDAEKSGVRSGSVDVILYCGVLHHFTGLDGLLSEAKRMLRKGGRIFFFEPNAANPILWLFRDDNSPFRSRKLKTPNERFLRVGQIRGALQKHKFEILRLGCVSDVGYTKEHFRKLFPSPLHFLVYPYNLFDRILHRTPLREKHGSFIYGAAKKK